MNILYLNPFCTAKVRFLRSMKFIHCTMLCCILLAFPWFLQEVFSAEAIAPARDISIVSKDIVDPVKPEWMNIWEEARALSRIEDYEAAAQLYGQLYSVKPGIEEASWEYCKVLIKTGDFTTVKNVLDSLLEQAPNRNDYLLMAGDVAYRNRDFDLAAQRFGKVFEEKPLGEQADLALQGMVNSLRALGKKKSAFPLLEQLALRKPNDLDIAHNAARDAQILGEYRKAKHFYDQLLQEPEVSDRVIFQAAKVYEELGDFENVIGLWLAYLEQHPDHIPFRNKVVDHFIEGELFDDAIVHLKYLISNVDDNADYFVRIGDLYLYNLNRPDKSLYYYELYLKKHPTDPKVRQKVVDVQTVLANDFLSIVENDGAWLLWRDLAAIAPNRLAIYLEMAEILEKKGKLRELIEILAIIFKESSKKDEIALRIAKHYTTLKEYDKALIYYGKLSGTGRTKNTFLLKASVEFRMGRKLQELDSRIKALQKDPLDTTVLKDCLVLAGKLGVVEKQLEIFDYIFKNKPKKSDLLELTQIHLHHLSANSMVTEYEKVYRWAQKEFQGNSHSLSQLATHWTDTLRKTGRRRMAEGILRGLLHSDMTIDTILLKLAENSVEDNRLKEAEEWLGAIHQMHPGCAQNQSCPVRCRLLLVEAKLLKKQGQSDEALTLLTDQIKLFQEKKANIPKECAGYHFEKEIVRLHILQENYAIALRIVDRLVRQKRDDIELVALRTEILRKIDYPNRTAIIEPISQGQFSNNPNGLLLLSGEMFEYKRYESARVFLKKFLKSSPSSVAGMLAVVELHTVKGELTDAAQILAVLAARFPNEKYIERMRIEIEMRLGKHEKAKAILANVKDSGSNIDELVDLLITDTDVDRLVLLARVLWGNKEFRKALEVYERLLSPSMAEMMSEQFGEKQLDYMFLTREDNFWNSLVYLLQSEPTVIEELMQPDFLLKNLKNDTGRIVSNNYEKYSWHKLIQSEYLARNATFKRKYFYAEQSYKRLLKEQESTEGMLDLASIYERIGEYRKEAKIYEVFQSSGGNAPDLESSIARTSKEISPLTGLDATYLEKSGRDGYMDSVMTSLGVSFHMTPNLNMDMSYQYEKRNYKSSKHDLDSSSNVLTGETTIELGTDYELLIGAGIEKLDSTSSVKLQYNLTLKGQLDDYLKAYFSIKKMPVTDTVHAIEEQIYYQGVGAGFNFDTPVGISIGGDYLNLDIDGGNSQRKYHWSTSYNIFYDFSELVFQYDYRHFSSDKENGGGLTENLVFTKDSLYYWSPDSFYEQLLSVHFKHYYLGYREANRLAKSYYSLNGGFGYEDDRDLSFTGGFDIFFEMGPRFLLNSNFTLQRSEDYEEARLSLSVNYRW